MSTPKADAPKPAWTRDSTAVRLPDVPVLGDLSPEWAWGGANGEGVRIAVIDSGIDADHPQLGNCVDEDSAVSFWVDAEGQAQRTDGPHRDAFGHGTACAGIIHSFAPLARITSVKVLGQWLTGKSAAFLAGLAWAVEEGYDIINLSLGTRRRDWALAFYELCDTAYFSGSFITTAANNIEQVSYPSMFSSVASVACNLTEDPYRFHFNPDPPTEFLARGIDVEVAWLDHETIRVTGNSFAAPHLAGLSALVKSKHRRLRPFQIKTVLWALAANVQEAPAEQAGRLSRTIRVTRQGVAAASRASRASRASHLVRPGSSF